MSTSLKTLSLSTLVVLILGLQSIVGLTYHSYTRWPFISYPMYAGANHRGDRISDFTLWAVLDDGREVEINEAMLGMEFWILRRNVLLPLVRQTTDNENTAEILRGKACAEFGEQLVGLKVYDVGVTVDKHGPVYGDPKVRANVNISCSA